MHAQPSRVVIERVTAKLREKCEDQTEFSKFLAFFLQSCSDAEASAVSERLCAGFWHAL